MGETSAVLLALLMAADAAYDIIPGPKHTFTSTARVAADVAPAGPLLAMMVVVVAGVVVAVALVVVILVRRARRRSDR